MEVFLKEVAGGQERGAVNSFGTPTLQFPLIDPRSMARYRLRFRREAVPELEYANSYYSLSGLWPDVGWILLDRYSYSRLNPYATNLRLLINDFINPTLTISNLTVIQARCITRGIASDPNAIYLVQVTNGIGVIFNQWYKTSVNVQYNVRSPAYPELYYSSTMNGSVAWTWDTMLGDLWARAPLQLGTYPHIPITPTGTPEGFSFVGVSLWEAIANILTHLGLTVVGSYPALGISVSGDTSATLTRQQALYAPSLVDDLEYLDGGSGRVPGSVVVYFHKRYQYYGTEETIRRDSNQWQASPVYSVTVASPVTQFSTATGVAHLWSDFTVRVDQDGVALAADVTAAALIAAERVSQFYKDIFRSTQGYMSQVYSGALPFETSSLVDGVRWYSSPQGASRGRAGWCTEIIRGYTWPEAMFMPTKQWGN